MTEHRSELAFEGLQEFAVPVDIGLDPMLAAPRGHPLELGDRIGNPVPEERLAPIHEVLAALSEFFVHGSIGVGAPRVSAPVGDVSSGGLQGGEV